VLKDLRHSSKALIEKKIIQHQVGAEFRVLRDSIETPGGGVIIFQGMQDHTAESVKSLEGFNVAFIEEAQTLSERSLSLLRPTIRAPGSEIWAAWNPTRNKDAIDKFLRQDPPANAIVVQANWRDNPWFPAESEAERRLELEKYPERYGHTLGGRVCQGVRGSLFRGRIANAKSDGRIGAYHQTRSSHSPFLGPRRLRRLRRCHGYLGRQFVGQSIRVLDYIEGQGQVLAYYVNELRARGYESAVCVLPHDGVNENSITGKRYEDHLADAGFRTEVVKNQGKGAASMRIEAVRRILPKCWFDERKTESGRDALGFYHEKKDEARGVGLGPEHDWSSHAADAFGLMAIKYEEPAPARKRSSEHVGGWMG
jgi:phage terminase large subunit